MNKQQKTREAAKSRFFFFLDSPDQIAAVFKNGGFLIAELPDQQKITILKNGQILRSDCRKSRF